MRLQKLKNLQKAEKNSPFPYYIINPCSALLLQGFFILETMKYLIAGLGNIGPEYELTRHNVGFLALDYLAEEKGETFRSERYAAHAEISHKGRKIHLIKPSTYMNLSGKAVQYWLTKLSIPKENLLVIVDDIALPFGKQRMRAKGSSAGHNGLKNIEDITGGQNYSRLKFGIGDDFPRGHQVDYVLSNFSRDEMDALPDQFKKTRDMIYGFATIGITRTMNQYNS